MNWPVIQLCFGSLAVQLPLPVVVALVEVNMISALAAKVTVEGGELAVPAVYKQDHAPLAWIGGCPIWPSRLR